MAAHNVIRWLIGPPCRLDIHRCQLGINRRSLVSSRSGRADVMEAMNKRASNSLPKFVTGELTLSVWYCAQALGKGFFVDSGLANVGLSSSDVVVASFTGCHNGSQDGVGQLNLISYVMTDLGRAAVVDTINGVSIVYHSEGLTPAELWNPVAPELFPVGPEL